MPGKLLDRMVSHSLLLYLSAGIGIQTEYSANVILRHYVFSISIRIDLLALLLASLVR